MRIHFVVFGICLLSIVPMASRAQFRSSCPFITAEEAATILGGKATRSEEAYVCTYALPGKIVTLVVALQSAGGSDSFIFNDSKREFIGKGALVKDEAGIGAAAFSFVNGDRDGRGSGFFVLIKGSGVLMIILQEQKFTGTPKSTERLDKLRPFIKRAVGRV